MVRVFTKENGGWPAHLHFQIATEELRLFGYAGDELRDITINSLEVFGIEYE